MSQCPSPASTENSENSSDSIGPSVPLFVFSTGFNMAVGGSDGYGQWGYRHSRWCMKDPVVQSATWPTQGILQQPHWGTHPKVSSWEKEAKLYLKVHHHICFLPGSQLPAHHQSFQTSPNLFMSHQTHCNASFTWVTFSVLSSLEPFTA